MIGQELTSHLQHVQKLLATLMSGYEDYQSRKSHVIEPSIPLKQHLLYITGIITAILIVTLSLSAFLNAAKLIVFSIAVGQMVLAIGVYILVMRKIIKDHHKRQGKSQVKFKSPMSIYELDQLRFKILQDLAKSPIPPAHITPTSVKKMLMLVESGMCISLDECLANIEKSTSEPKHIEELEIIEHLQMISYH
ncbi:hypothetical protein [Metabacillus schmidteae]|uniref:hypothetical protein n=1 Tax=Metabacillus schmidteae TaxID=2730405 RepID=UPI00158EFB8D|nr:hypothetical protein [Metabacillus schmidteae]